MAHTSPERSVVPTAADRQPAALAADAVLPEELADGEGGVMTLREHLIELRDRIIKSLLGLVAGSVAGFLMADYALGYLARLTCLPGQTDCRLQILDPTEGIITYLQVSLYIGVALSTPIIGFQIIRFMAPGLTRSEKRILYTALPFVAILFVAGSTFAVFPVLPAMLGFLAAFKSDIFLSEFRAAATVRMALTLMLWLGLVFELPLVMVILARLRIIHWRRMLSWWRYALVIIMVAAAVITPTPDPVNMMIVATPMILLYALGVALARVFGASAPSSLPTSVAP